MLKMRELNATDSLLAIDEKGKPNWSTIGKGVRRFGRTKILQITTDVTEALLSEDCGIFTIDGMKKSTQISKGDLIETFNIPAETRLALENGKQNYVLTDIGPIVVRGKIAYILGTQVVSKKHEQIIEINCASPDHANLAAKLCSEALQEQFILGKVNYSQGERKVRVYCEILASICSTISRTNIPLDMIKSSATSLREFVCGMLDTTLHYSGKENKPVHFDTSGDESELRRLVLNVLRLYNIMPINTDVTHTSEKSSLVRTYFDLPALSRLGLKSVTNRQSIRTYVSTPRSSYSIVRDVTEIHDIAYQISLPYSHWSPVIDLMPLHRHVLP